MNDIAKAYKPFSSFFSSKEIICVWIQISIVNFDKYNYFHFISILISCKTLPCYFKSNLIVSFFCNIIESVHHKTHMKLINPFYLQSLGLSSEDIALREVDFIDIAYDPLVEKHYKEEEVRNYFQPYILTYHT